MVTLRLSQVGPLSGGGYPIEIAVEGVGPRRTAVATVGPIMDEADRARIRWYLEDYLIRNADPAPKVAAGVERRMVEIGRQLFSAIFEANRDTTRLWNQVSDRLADTRVEISASIREAHTVPWELLRDPRTDAPLALNAAEFVNVQSQVARQPQIMSKEADGPARILMVICRPRGADDVSFRSVAIRIVKALTDVGATTVRLEVLRPPTFAELGRRLRQAKANGRPYHAVHFDGHGLYIDIADLAELEHQEEFDPQRLRPPTPAGARGYICFESDVRANRIFPVDGVTLGNLLYETAVPTLMLNACRSGHAPAVPLDNVEATDVPAPLAQEDQVRAYGSFAQAVVDAGVAGVVAMRYNVYVTTAAQFVGELYQTLTQGHTLGHAASLARKHLNDDRVRTVTGEPVELQDWLVPAIYEAAPITLFPRRDIVEPLFDDTAWTASTQSSELPRVPDAGFIGGDETLLANRSCLRPASDRADTCVCRQRQDCDRSRVRTLVP